MINMFLSNNPSFGDINSSNLSCSEVYLKVSYLVLQSDLGSNTLKSIQIHYNYFNLSMITITLQLQDL